jgi:hypothetical protein
MQSYSRLFLQALSVMNLLSKKVYFAGLTSLWPEITRIPNLPHEDAQVLCISTHHVHG